MRFFRKMFSGGELPPKDNGNKSKKSLEERPVNELTLDEVRMYMLSLRMKAHEIYWEKQGVSSDESAKYVVTPESSNPVHLSRDDQEKMLNLENREQDLVNPMDLEE